MVAFDVVASGAAEDDGPLEAENLLRKIVVGLAGHPYPPRPDVSRGSLQRVLSSRPGPDGAPQFLVVCEATGSMEGAVAAPQEKWRCRACHLQDPPVWQAFNDTVRVLSPSITSNPPLTAGRRALSRVSATHCRVWCVPLRYARHAARRAPPRVGSHTRAPHR